MEALGQDIGISYARILYPELRHLRDQGEKLSFEERSANKAVKAYSFTLRHYRDHYELGSLMTRDTLWENSILYEETKERFTEEFVFSSLTPADAMHGAWERYIAGKTHRPPVKYCLIVRHDTDETSTVLSVTHARLTDKNSRKVESDGSTIEKIIFDSPFEAEAMRETLSKVERKTQEQKKHREIPQSQEKNKSKEKTLEHHKEQMVQVHETAMKKCIKCIKKKQMVCWQQLHCC